jgi:uncharacterized protein involved in outer membrane biogenesis
MGQVKRYLIVFGIIIIGLVAAALIIPSFLDWTKYRAEIEGAAEAATGRDVAIEGDISFAVLPMPALTAEKITLSNLSGGIARDMVTLDKLSVRVGLWPLLFGRVEVRSVVLVRPVIALEVLPDGRQNWDFAAADSEPAEESGGGDVKLDHFSIEDGTLTYEDMRSGARHVVRQINMTVVAESLKGPMSAKGSLNWRDTPLKLDARMGSQDKDGRAPVSGEVEVGGAKIKLNGVAGLGDAPELSGKIAVTAAKMTPLLAAIHSLSEGEGDHMALSLPLEVESDVTYGNDAVTLANLRLALGETKAAGAVKATLGDATAVDVTLAASVLDLDALMASLPKTEEESSFDPKDTLAQLNDLKLTGKAAITAEAVRYKGRIVREATLKLVADGKTINLTELHALMPGSSEVTASARFARQPAPAVNGKVTLTSGSLRGLLEWLDMLPPDVAQSRLQSFSLTSDVGLMGNVASAENMVMKLDTMTARGSARYINGTPVRLDADVNIDRLDLTGYVPADTCVFGQDAKPATAAKDSAKSEPSTMALTLKARVGQLVCGKITGQNLVLDVAQAGDTITLHKVEAASLAGLALNVSGKIAGQGDKMSYAMKGSVSGKSLAGLDQAAPGLLPLPPSALKAGPVDMTFDVNGDPKRIAFDGQGALGGTKLQGKGVVVPENPGKEGFKSLDVSFAVNASSLASLIQQWELGLTPPQPADDKPVSLAGTVKGPSSALAVDVNGTVATAALAVNGVVRQAAEAMSYDLKTKVDGKDARAFVRGLGVEFGEGVEGLGPIALSGGVVGSDESVSLNGLTGQFGPVKLNGAATIKLGEPRPNIQGDFRAGDIPVDRFLPPAPEEKKGATKTATKHEWSKEPFNTEFLKSFDADVKFRADSLTVKGYKFEQPKFALLVQNGQLRVDGLTGKLFDGDVSLDFAFGGAAKNPMSLKFDVRNASMTKALQTAANINAVTGTMNLSGDFSGAGASPYELVRSLSGGADLSLTEGIIKGIDMPRLSQGLTALRDNGSLGSLLSSALAGGQTKHKGFAGRVNSTNGVLNLSNMVVELDAAKALLGATVDLPKWSVNSAGRLQLSEHPSTPAIGVNITGLLDGPTVAYDTKAFKKHMEAHIAKAVLQSVTSGGGLNQLLGRPTQQEGTATEGQTATQPATSNEPAQQTQPAETEKPKDPGKLLLDQFIKSIDKKKQPAQ